MIMPVSSLEVRPSGELTAYRIRYRHQGQNHAVTFPTRESALDWQKTLDQYGHDFAIQSVYSARPPNLSAFNKHILSTKFGGVPLFDPRGMFVYMLWGIYRDCPVYVGATTNLPRRLGQHMNEKGEYFNRVSVIKVSDDKAMWRLEAHLIAHYKPVLNQMAGRAA